jgi:hypothetical protein
MGEEGEGKAGDEIVEADDNCCCKDSKGDAAVSSIGNASIPNRVVEGNISNNFLSSTVI